MPITQRFDRLLLGGAILQTGVGLALLGSASWLIATERYGRPGSYFFTWQAATALVGLGVLVVCMHLRSDLLTEPRLARVAVGVSWLLLAAAYLQSPVAATHRWLSVGGLSLQPSVLARIAVTVWAAGELEVARREGWPAHRLRRLMAVCGVTALLIIAEPDLGSGALLLVVLAAMAFVAGLPMRLIAAPAALGVAALGLAVVASPYRLARVRAFFDAGSGTATAAGWQSHQSLVAIGSGGLTGRGYGAGLQKLFFLPEPHTDFIFSIAGEELGLLGLLGLIGLIALIVWRGLRIASRLASPDRALLAFGLIFAFAVQSLLHMVVCLDLLPPKGIPLPLVSYGKTDLVVTLASIGLLLNLSRETGG
ncbi:MAG: FtsW/RodA/SpoVE family cell cycle protein [Thermoanaerobaculales bacterium]|nr:FtsW/RodA/SpoVE family cell cycle protein [Thermoanaerobaculales bacterium]